MFPKLNNYSEIKLASSEIKSHRSENIQKRNKSPNYFPYLQDLRKLLIKPESFIHSKKLKNKAFSLPIKQNQSADQKDCFLKEENPIKIEKNQVFPNFQDSPKISPKKNDQNKVLKNDSHNDNETPQFPLINSKIDNIFTENQKKSYQKENSFEFFQNISKEKVYIERFLKAGLNFFSFKQKNQLNKEKIGKNEKKEDNVHNINMVLNLKNKESISSVRNIEKKEKAIIALHSYRENKENAHSGSKSLFKIKENANEQTSRKEPINEAINARKIHSSYWSQRKLSFEALMVNLII